MTDSTPPRNRLHVAIDCLVMGDRPSGVERAVAGLVEGLAAIEPPEQRFSLLIAEGRRERVQAGQEMALLAAPHWARSRAGRVLWEQLLAGTRLRSERVDLVHGAAYVLPLAWEGPAVVTVHDTITLTHPEWCQWHNVLHYGLVMTQSILRADAVIVPSEFTKRELIAQLAVEPGRVHVAPLGVAREFAPAAEEAVARMRERHGLSERYLLCVGNVEPRKNLEAVIEAFATIADAIPHSLVIAGKRGWKCGPIVRAIERSRLASRIRWLDWVPHEELVALYSGAEVCIQWSLHEGFGLTPLEAMACGTPAIVSDGGALPEVAGEAAEVVPQAAGAEGLAQALLALVRDPVRRAEMSRRGIEHAARYTWAEHARIASQVYREVCGAQV